MRPFTCSSTWSGTSIACTDGRVILAALGATIALVIFVGFAVSGNCNGFPYLHVSCRSSPRAAFGLLVQLPRAVLTGARSPSLPVPSPTAVSVRCFCLLQRS